MTQKERIEELERKVAELELRLAMQEARPVYIPWQTPPPVYPWQSPFTYFDNNTAATP